MPTIRLDSFGGILPRAHPTLLPEGCATRAHNCRLKSGKLSPLREPALVGAAMVRQEAGLGRIADARSLYLWRRGGVAEFLAFPGLVTVVRGNIADDEKDRLFVTGQTGVGGNLPCLYASEGGAMVRHPITKSKMAAPVVSRTDERPLDELNLRYTVFYQTWVDRFGYMSGLSAPSSNKVDDDDDGTFEYNDGDEVTVGEAADQGGAVRRRIYKLVTGFETQSVQFVVEQEASGEGFGPLTFRVPDEDAGGVVPRFESPPDDLDLMTPVPGGFYCGVSGSRRRTLMFSEVNAPTSWPEAYQYDVDDDIVGVGVAGNTVYVLTAGMPWAVSGTHPDGMVCMKIPCDQACVSRRGICVMESGVFYPSHDGIVMLAPELGASARVITEKHWSKREWADMNPSSCVMAPYDGALHAWFNTGSGLAGYIIDLREGLAAITTHDEVARAVCYDGVDDALYYVRRKVE